MGWVKVGGSGGKRTGDGQGRPREVAREVNEPTRLDRTDPPDEGRAWTGPTRWSLTI